MAIKAKISVDNSELTQGLQQAENQAKKTGKSINEGLANNGGAEALDKLGRNADEAVRALDSVAGATGAASTGLSGLAGDIIALVNNPIAMFIAAFGALVAVGVKVWDKLTLSTEEYIAKQEQALARTKKTTEEIERKGKNHYSMMEKLWELSNVVDKTAHQMYAMDEIVKLLNNEYKGLGLSIDWATGKVKNFEEAQAKLFKLITGNNIEALHTQAATERDIIRTTLGLNIRKKEKRKYQTKVGNGGDWLINKYSEVGRLKLTSIEEIDRMIAAVQQKFKESKDAEEQKKINDVLEKLMNLRRTQAQIDSYKSFGVETTDQYYQQLLKYTTQGDAEARENDKREKAAAKTIEDSKKKFEHLILKPSLNEQYSGLYTTGQQQQSQLDALNEQLTDAGEQYKEQWNKFKKLVEEWQAGRDSKDPDVRAKFETPEWRNMMIAESNKLTVARANYNSIYERFDEQSKQAVKTFEDLYKIKQQMDDFFVGANEKLQKQVDLQRLLIQGKTDEYTLQKLINEAKEKNIKITEEDGTYTEAFNEMLEKRNAVAAQMFQNELTVEAQQLEYQAMRNAGLQKEVDLILLKNKIEKTTGKTLDDGQVDQLKELINLQHELNNTDLNLRLHGTLTNELARRGGFNSSVISDRKTSINEQIRNNGRTANQLLTEIRDFTKKNGVIQ